MESSTRLFAGSAGVPFETWEVGAVRLDAGWVVLCRSADVDRFVTSDVGEGEALSELVWDALAKAAAEWRSRPARVEVADAELARILDHLLAGSSVLVEITETPEMRRLLKELACSGEDSGPLQLESRKVEGNPGSSCSPARKESLP